jgi:hypothetical protein
MINEKLSTCASLANCKSVQEFSDFCGVPVQTLYDWRTKYPKRVACLMAGVKAMKNTNDLHEKIKDLTEKLHTLENK